MRMWMIPPAQMCRQHLLGEHVEIHMFIGSILKGVSMRGYAKNGLIEPAKLFERHQELVAEMQVRGYKHKSPLDELTVAACVAWLPEKDAVVDVEASKADLFSRCPECSIRRSA